MRIGTPNRDQLRHELSESGLMPAINEHGLVVPPDIELGGREQRSFPNWHHIYWPRAEFLRVGGGGVRILHSPIEPCSHAEPRTR